MRLLKLSLKNIHGEEGVRNLKRCIETIVSKINIHIYPMEIVDYHSN